MSQSWENGSKKIQNWGSGRIRPYSGLREVANGRDNWPGKPSRRWSRSVCEGPVCGPWRGIYWKGTVDEQRLVASGRLAGRSEEALGEGARAARQRDA